MDWLERLLLGIGGLFVVLCVALVSGALVVASYFALTGGFDTTTTERVNGVKCVVTRDRLDRTVKQLSCPVRKP